MPDPQELRTLKFVIPPEPTAGGCEHDYIDIDTVLRRVTCRECGHILDPIQCLETVFAEWENFDRRASRIRIKETGEDRP